jgi:hypothetical protein
MTMRSGALSGSQMNAPSCHSRAELLLNRGEIGRAGNKPNEMIEPIVIKDGLRPGSYRVRFRNRSRVGISIRAISSHT